MTTGICALGSLHLVLQAPVWQDLPARQRQYPRWPASPGHLAADLEKFVEGVPCYVGEGQGKWQGQTQFFICTPIYQLLAVPSQRGDTYRVPWMKPLGLREHERLARGALLLQPVHWRIHTSFDTVPAGISNYADQVLHAWAQLQSDTETREPPLASITRAQESYLNTVGQLIEVSRRLVMDRAALEAPVGYRAVESAAELRQTARDAYRFHLESKPPRLDQGDPLRLRGSADVRGRVLSLDGDWLTVRFETAVDRAQIPEQGVLERVASDKPFKLQQEAVEMLRDGDASNPHLLPILVDGAYLPYRAPIIPPSENPPQEEAFRRSLTMPDLLLVLGPPGTGKTRTIAKIVGQHGREQRRVLVTAKTHKAVDNVLEKLPIELTTVRIGHEDRVSESTRHLLIDAQARTLQQSIIRQTEAHFHALAELVSHGEQLARRLDQLAKLSDEMEATETRHQAAQQHLDGTRQHLEAQHNQQRASLQASLDQQRQCLRQLDSALNSLSRQLAAAHARQEIPLIGRFWTWWAGHLVQRQAQRQQQRQQDQATYDAEVRAYRHSEREQQKELHSPEFRALEHQVQFTAQAHAQAARAASEAARQWDAAVAGLGGRRPSLEPLSPATLQRYLAWLRDIIPLLERRHEILQEWRTRLESRTEELYPVIIRMADVVGATCIGIATDDAFENLDFDLAIADEAGQISLPDLLVPLVRARRALLVGDHHQLPPFVENEVQAWLKQVRPEVLADLNWLDTEDHATSAILDLLTKSVFEMLFPVADPSRVVRFTQQYRMPEAVADFAGRCFYEGQFYTAAAEKRYGAAHEDPLFARPLAFVDTSDIPQQRRREAHPSQDHSDPEGWGKSGYINRLEADLIADIVVVYQRHGLEWVVIVPYKAQAGLIRRQLRRRLDPSQDLNLEERVSTVDSFQGGECSRVIYGFTRSNQYGSIGFLRELRRLNVALTRTQEQLVMVGDAETLTQTNDLPFRETMQALREHVRRTGQWLSYEACRARLVANRESL